MWPFSKRSARREEIRRSRAEREVTLIQRFRGRFETGPLLLTVLAAAAGAVILNVGGEVLAIRVGQALPRAYTSRLELRIADDQATREMRVRARDTAPNWYELNQSLIEDIRGRLTSLLTIAKAHSGDPERVKAEATQNGVVLDDAGVAEALRLAAADDVPAFQRIVDAVMRALAQQPLVEYDESAQRRTPVEAIFVDPNSGTERSLPVARLQFTNNRENVVAIAEATAAAASAPLRASIRASIEALLSESRSADRPLKPIYRYLSERTIQHAQRAFESVPVQYLSYGEGAVLADAGVVSADERALLLAEQQQFRKRQAASDAAWRAAGLAVAGRSALVLVIAAGLAGYIARYQPKAIRQPLRQVTMVVVVLFALAAGRALFLWTAEPYIVVGAQAFAATLLGLVFARGLVFAVCGALAALLTLGTQQGVGFLVVLVAVSGVLVFLLQDVRSRGRIVAVGGVGGVVAFGGAAAAGLIDGQTAWFVAREGAIGALATISAAFLVEGLLPGIERLFGFSTSMTLLEWCDANRPLLRLLAAEAPGTYNHSLLVGALAEKACEAIGANGLLARAGAYYHDIGKTNKPEYFVENQGPQFSRHERLSPAMSLLIIINHVKDGIEMAREYRLPASLRPFIAEHHGTTIVEYFYAAASRARRPGDPPIPEAQFRYPGPKPQSRESAVVLLCDGVEGAVRAMPEPTPARIEDTVTMIVRKRLLDGQFDECDLNFRDLAAVERSLIKSLNAIYHGRIAYPAQPAQAALRESQPVAAEEPPALAEPPAPAATPTASPLDVGG